jgi:translation elongation factor EF-Tu-like GTPase
MVHTATGTAGHIDHGRTLLAMALLAHADREGWTERRGDVRVRAERPR